MFRNKFWYGKTGELVMLIITLENLSDREFLEFPLISIFISDFYLVILVGDSYKIL